MSGTVAALLLIGTSVLNCAGAVLNMLQARRLHRRVVEHEERQRALWRCAGMVAFIARSELCGAPPALRRECAKILPPDLEIVIHESSSSSSSESVH